MLQRISILFLLNLLFITTVIAQDAGPNYLELGITQNKTGNYADALRNFSIEIEKIWLIQTQFPFTTVDLLNII